VKSFDFPSRVGLFPQLAATGVIIFSLTVVLEKYIPDYLIPERDNSKSDHSRDKGIPTDKNEEDEIETTSGEEDAPQRNARRGLNLSIWSSTYLLTSYLFGFLWMTPIFVLLYGYLRDMSIVEAVSLALISVIIAYAFMTVTRVPIDEGTLTTYILTNQI